MDINNPGLSEEAVNMLKNYPWPGNVRELENTIQKALIFNRGAPVSTEDISQAISGKVPTKGTGSEAGDEAVRNWIRQLLSHDNTENMFDSCIDRFASMTIGEALNITGGNRSRAAKLLGLSRPTLHSKIEKYKLKLETSVKKG